MRKADKILTAYPPDRFRGKVACLDQIEEANKEGIRPKDLRLAVQAYATDSAGRLTLRSKRKTEIRRRRWRPITMRGWPAGSLIATQCANTSRGSKLRLCAPLSW